MRATTLELREMANLSVSLEQTIEALRAKLPPFFPLRHFIASNPLAGRMDRPFKEAIQSLEQTLGHAPATLCQRYDKLYGAQLSRMTRRWCVNLFSTYLDEGESYFRESTGAGLWADWKSWSRFDFGPGLAGIRGFRERVRALPDRPILALERELSLQNWSASARETWLASVAAAYPGWYSALNATSKDDFVAALTIVGLYDLWMAGARADLDVLMPQENKVSVPAGNLLFQQIENAEKQYREQLFADLKSSTKVLATAPKAQAIFCIDVRSEVFRRQLEHGGPYETYGFAGFFGLAVKHRVHSAVKDALEKEIALHPAPLSAKFEARVIETTEGRSHLRRKVELWKRMGSGYKAVSERPASSFAFVEVFGVLFLLKLIASSLRKKLFSARGWAEKAMEEWPADLNMPMPERIKFAQTALKMMGFSRNIAPVVLVLGHRGQSVNNPFAASLDCGACGGNPGGFNARLFAKILNAPEVREALTEAGYRFSPSTVFVPGEHNTTTDEIRLFDAADLTAEQRKQVQDIQKDLLVAGSKTARERLARFAGFKGSDEAAFQEAHARATDWSEVRPEWGLIRNAAFIAAPREYTRSVNLEGRSFLHSYRASEDTEYSALETILTAPLVVAHWINQQYLFSSLTPSQHSSGNKVVHNVVGRMGVMSGNEGDLLQGLPMQSVSDGSRVLHDPIRLNAVIAAPASAIEAICRKHSFLSRWIEGEWLTLWAWDPESGNAPERIRVGGTVHAS
jgi:uncharacterized protein YbcC (UPF0753/DUF2309 family)